MENHKHCRNCGNMISCVETLCPVCGAVQRLSELPLPLREAIEKWIDSRAREKEVKK